MLSLHQSVPPAHNPLSGASEMRLRDQLVRVPHFLSPLHPEPHLRLAGNQVTCKRRERSKRGSQIYKRQARNGWPRATQGSRDGSGRESASDDASIGRPVTETGSRPASDLPRSLGQGIPIPQGRQAGSVQPGAITTYRPRPGSH